MDWLLVLFLEGVPVTSACFPPATGSQTTAKFIYTHAQDPVCLKDKMDYLRLAL